MSDSISSKKKDTKSIHNNTKEITKKVLHNLPKTISHFFPDFISGLRRMPDSRKRTEYELLELMMGGITMHLFKEGSRNAYNNDRRDDKFRSNYESMFNGIRLPHMDTVDDQFRNQDPKLLEDFKAAQIRGLIEKRVLHKERLLGKYFVVAIDGTGVASYKKRHCDKCLTKTYSNGKTVYFHNVLEAKLVMLNGLTISIGTEWIENDDDEYEKQDCELKSFYRLSEKLKKYYPRLPICIVGDGLYPNQKVFEICERNQWKYIITLRDGNLPTVWEEVRLLLPIEEDNKIKQTLINKNGEKETSHRWIEKIDYSGHKLSWIETVETKRDSKTEKTNRFVYVSNLEIKEKTAAQISCSGRLRTKIENEGFNEQKNNGYELEHKYSEVSLKALKNYYQCLQIAAMINQLLVLGQKLKMYLKEKITIKHLWKNLKAFLLYGEIDREKIIELNSIRIQIRLE